MRGRIRHFHSQQKGFTIIEFLIATMIFSFVILICSYAIIHVGRMYYKGVVTNRTQDTARRVVDDVVASVQFGLQVPTPAMFARLSNVQTYNGVPVQALCLGDVRYTYAPTAARGDNSGLSGDILWSRHVLWRDILTSTDACVPLDITQANPGGNDGRELIGQNMRLPVFEVIVPEPGESWRVNTRVVYGDHPDLFEDGIGFSICRGALAGGQFCAVSSFSTSVTKRL